MKKFLFLLLTIAGVGVMSAQTVSFQHNDWKTQQYDHKVYSLLFSQLESPNANSNWLKEHAENYSGDLPEGTTYTQLIRRYNGSWMFGALFDWFTIDLTTPAYSLYTYTLHFKLSVDQADSKSVTRAALMYYGKNYDRWNGRGLLPNGALSFCTSTEELEWNEIKPGEFCTVRLADGTDTLSNTCVIPITIKHNGTATSDQYYFGFASSKNLDEKNHNYAHNTYLYAYYTAELVGYVKHVVYSPNATGIGDAEMQDIVKMGVVRDSVFSRANYTFTGWNTRGDGKGTAYKPGDSIHVDEATKGELTLYAQWAPNSYVVKLDKQGGIGDPDSVIAYTDCDMPTIAIPSRGMANFLGYFTEPMGKGIRYYNANGTSAHRWDANERPHLYAYWSDHQVYYIDEDGLKKFVSDYSVITAETKTLSAGWHVSAGTDVETGRLACQGDVKLILLDGTRLTARGGSSEPGIQVTGNSSLTIYAQEEKSGELIAYGDAAGIGGGTYEDGGNITIYSGIISAYGGDSGAGIGSGYGHKGHHIFIYGGVVTAQGSTCIGHGSMGSANDIYVSSSLMLCAGNDNPPTTYIPHTTEQDLTSLLAGKWYAVARPFAKEAVVTFDRQGGTGGTEQLILNDGDPMPNIEVPTREGFVFRGYYAGPDGAGLKYYDAEGVSTLYWTRQENTTLYALWGEVIAYVDVDGTTKYVDVRSIITSETTTLKNDWYAVRGEDVQTGELNCSGDVHLILMDGAKLTATGNAGIVVYMGNKLTIYGQEEQSGQLIATATGSGAGIGSSGANGDITINGGVITATATGGGAGIGGGNGGCGMNITINRGHVTATGGEGAAGIGGGNGKAYYGKNITINGGVVKATGGNRGAGIGGGSQAYGQYIFINGGDVTAVGGNYAAGIGGGSNGSGEDITINGGRISATGGSDAAGIGGGNDDWGHGSDIRINGGEITANGGVNASAIGGGNGTYSYTVRVFVSSLLILKADNNNPPTTVIAHTSSDNLDEKVHMQRYAIIQPGESPTGVVNVNANANVNKVLRDGQLYIERDSRVYNAQGGLVY